MEYYLSDLLKSAKLLAPQQFCSCSLESTNKRQKTENNEITINCLPTKQLAYRTGFFLHFMSCSNVKSIDYTTKPSLIINDQTVLEANTPFDFLLNNNTPPPSSQL